jgi:hypothetical protein
MIACFAISHLTEGDIGMRKYTYYIVRAATIIAFALVVTRVGSGEAVGGPKHFEGELKGETYTPYKIEFEGGKHAIIRVDFAPKYQRERSEDDCRNFEAKVFNEKGEWIMTAKGQYVYEEDKGRGVEVVRCKVTAGDTLKKGGIKS